MHSRAPCPQNKFGRAGAGAQRNLCRSEGCQTRSFRNLFNMVMCLVHEAPNRPTEIVPAATPSLTATTCLFPHARRASRQPPTRSLACTTHAGTHRDMQVHAHGAVRFPRCDRHARRKRKRRGANSIHAPTSVRTPSAARKAATERALGWTRPPVQTRALPFGNSPVGDLAQVGWGSYVCVGGWWGRAGWEGVCLQWAPVCMPRVGE